MGGRITLAHAQGQSDRRALRLYRHVGVGRRSGVCCDRNHEYVSIHVCMQGFCLAN